jgi:hypothetical protein
MQASIESGVLLVVVDDEFDPGFADRNVECFDSTVVVSAVSHDEKAVLAPLPSWLSPRQFG